jgi:acyl-CoA thioester hydrolase
MDRFLETFVVRWGDCDLNGHVRNTLYSEYCIETRMAYLTKHGFGYEQFAAHALGPVILREEIDYRRELRVGERVGVDFWQLGLSPDFAKFKLAHDLYKENGKQAARVVLFGGWMDLRSRKLVVPPELLARAMVHVPRGEPAEELAPLSSKKREE